MGNPLTSPNMLYCDAGAYALWVAVVVIGFVVTAILFWQRARS